MVQLRLFLFGSPRLERDGAVVAMDTRKAIALLAYLTLTGRVHSRDTLAALFWPEYEQSQARGNLRRTLSTLTKAIGKDLLEVDRDNIGLIPDKGLWVDVARFQELLAIARGHAAEETNPTCLSLLTEALALYRADFMVGFSLSDSPNFEEWQFLQSENLRRELTWVLDRLINNHSQQGDFAAALETAQRWVALDPLDEGAQRQLMQFYAWTGQRSAALRCYQNLVCLLDEELGVSPGEEMQALHQAIVENKLPRPEPDNPPPLLKMGEHREAHAQTAELSEQEYYFNLKPQPSLNNLPAQTKPFVGREAELSALNEMLVDPGCRLLTLVGPGGVGKTRLAIEAASHHVEHFADGILFVSLAPPHR